MPMRENIVPNIDCLFHPYLNEESIKGDSSHGKRHRQLLESSSYVKICKICCETSHLKWIIHLSGIHLHFMLIPFKKGYSSQVEAS